MRVNESSRCGIIVLSKNKKIDIFRTTSLSEKAPWIGCLFYYSKNIIMVKGTERIYIAGRMGVADA